MRCFPDFIIRRCNRETHGGRCVNLRSAHHDVSSDAERSIATDVTAVRDEFRFTDALQRKAADINQVRPDREASVSKCWVQIEWLSVKQERGLPILRKRGRDERRAECNIGRAEFHGAVAKNYTTIRHRERAHGINRDRACELHCAPERE